MNPPKIIYAGDRDISVWALEYIIQQGLKPLALLTSDETRATHADELMAHCDYLDKSHILKGNQFRTNEGMKLLEKLSPDYIICVHFPYIIPKDVLEIPKYGVLNLHPAYLPYNRGWHTPTWAIWDNTPYGATLHFMDEMVDAGDIINQKRIEIHPDDTADSLYKRVKLTELEVFKEAFPTLLSCTYNRKPQTIENGSIHKKMDIDSIQFIDLNEQIKVDDLIRQLRALTTNDISESAYFKIKEKSYRIQLHVEEDNV